jgi:hypothetical protein
MRGVEDTNQRTSLNLRITPDLKQRVRNWAASKGIGINAAAAILLDQALRQDLTKERR